MDSQEAIEYLNRMHANEAPQTSEAAESKGATDATGGQTGVQDTPAPEPEAGSGSEPQNAEEPVKEAQPQQQPQQPQKNRKPSRQERIDHAFQRVNRKHKAEIEARDRRIAELEEKIKKYGPLEQLDFDPNDMKSYIDHKFALQGEKAELDRLKADRERLAADERMGEAMERHDRQVAECFQDEAERERYWTLLRNGGQKFREFLDAYDRDGTIDSYIGESPIAPIMIRTLMGNPETLKSIVETRNPVRKAFALQQLENRLMLQRRLQAGQARTASPQGQQPNPAPKLPIVGSQVSNPGSNSETTKRDWNRFLAEHP